MSGVAELEKVRGASFERSKEALIERAPTRTRPSCLVSSSPRRRRQVA
jgi:hypothetical protein